MIDDAFSYSRHCHRFISLLVSADVDLLFTRQGVLARHEIGSFLFRYAGSVFSGGDTRNGSSTGRSYTILSADDFSLHIEHRSRGDTAVYVQTLILLLFIKNAHWLIIRRNMSGHSRRPALHF